MPTATFAVELSRRPDPDGVHVDGQPVACTPAGVDTVQFTFSAHPSSPARPLGKGASGGELSRTMLALEVVLAEWAGTAPDQELLQQTRAERAQRLSALSHPVS